MKKFIAIVLSVLPSFAFAQSTVLSDVNDVASRATNIGNLVIAIAISFAVVWIIVAVVRYFIAGGEEDRVKGKEAIIYGVIGLFVILSIWGLVAILKSSFKTNDIAPKTQINQTTGLLVPDTVK